MTPQKEHRITIKIADVEPFRLPVREDEESFYRHVIDQINANVTRLRNSAKPESSQSALAKVALYYAVMLYRKTNLINSQTELLDAYEMRLDALLQSIE